MKCLQASALGTLPLSHEEFCCDGLRLVLLASSCRLRHDDRLSRCLQAFEHCILAPITQRLSAGFLLKPLGWLSDPRHSICRPFMWCCNGELEVFGHFSGLGAV
eukprot:5152336-Amphidinium_carterae.1